MIQFETVLRCEFALGVETGILIWRASVPSRVDLVWVRSNLAELELVLFCNTMTWQKRSWSSGFALAPGMQVSVTLRNLARDRQHVVEVVISGSRAAEVAHG